jgi:hypothetical protein
LTDFHGNKAKKIKNQKKISKWPTQKTEFFKIANSQHFFVKISWIGPWLSRID